MTNKSRVALIQFPGSNCEQETKRAAEAAGLAVDIFRWNRDAALLAGYAGYIIGGGFSYQDRVRAGAIATKEPIVRTVVEEALRGKPCLGICNGAQVLVESGLIPGITPGEVEMALAPNRVDAPGRISHYSCQWTYLKHTARPGRCGITSEFQEGEVWPAPIAHGEGRYATQKADLLERLIANDQIVLRYCDADGAVEDTPATNPNGSMDNIAGICNPDGNVLAMMPHPERASWVRQMPYELGGPWAAARQKARGDFEAVNAPGPGRKLFASFRRVCEFAAG
ncbi:MAG: phosphoribosylformylglycinamidine synthase I [Armatimonadota bacterium]|jgi:phosphoribosylformylglycinamidine synthase